MSKQDQHVVNATICSSESTTVPPSMSKLANVLPLGTKRSKKHETDTCVPSIQQDLLSIVTTEPESTEAVAECSTCKKLRLEGNKSDSKPQTSIQSNQKTLSSIDSHTQSKQENTTEVQDSSTSNQSETEIDDKKRMAYIFESIKNSAIRRAIIATQEAALHAYSSLIVSSMCLAAHGSDSAYNQLQTDLTEEEIARRETLFHKLQHAPEDLNAFDIKQLNRDFVYNKQYYRKMFMPVLQRIYRGSLSLTQMLIQVMIEKKEEEGREIVRDTYREVIE